MPRFAQSIALLLLLSSACSSWTPDRPVVQTEAGGVRGSAEDDVQIFRGIPYAAPPVGPLRFRPTEPPRAWSGVRDGREFGEVCPQPEFGMTDFLDNLVESVGLSWWRRAVFSAAGGLMSLPKGSEDCLFLNVWTPGLDGAAPVMVWFHGGGHTAGSGSQLPTLGMPYAKRGNVVVSINYRLGVFGYLAHSSLIAESEHHSAGNYGTLDQVAALRWVRDNIAAFGGDPERVTIFGESAGGMSVAQLMASPLARGLFDAAISQSGTAAHQFLDLHEARGALAPATQSGDRVLEALGSKSDALSALRSASTADLMQAFTEHGGELTLLLHPNVDGWVLEEPVATTFQAGRQAPVPYILGFNADEGSLLYKVIRSPLWDAPPVSTVDDWQELVADRFDSDAMGVATLYPIRDSGEIDDVGKQMLGDSMFGAPTLFSARAHAEAGNPTYLYFVSKHSAAENQTAGAYHAIDLQYVFDSPMPLFPWDEQDQAIADSMVGFWSGFAQRRAPGAEGQPPWPTFEPNDPRWMEFGATIGLTRARQLDRLDMLERNLIQRVIDQAATAAE